jgi:hypothetical protein
MGLMGLMRLKGLKGLKGLRQEGIEVKMQRAKVKWQYETAEIS